MISVSYLNECISLIGPCANLVWKKRPDHHFASKTYADRWNKAFEGKPALCTPSPRGYLVGMIRRTNLLAHRVVVALDTGEWPDGVVDHINRIKHDNRVKNLRVVDCVQNRRNRGLDIRNSSGVTGVYWNNQRKKWHAQITRNGKITHLVLTDDFQEAVMARKYAEGIGT